eukprot:EG_transcript_4404
MSGPVKLFVGNLPPSCAQGRLEELAAPFGQVTHVHLMSRQAASGAICAFVEMASHEQAKMVIQALDGKATVPPHSTPVSVSFAVQHNRGGAPPAGAAGAVPKLFVGNLPADVTEAALDALFRQYGRLERIVMVAKPSPSGNRSAFAIFSSLEECKYAISVLDGRYTFPNGRDTIVVRFADGAAAGPERRYGGPMPVDAGARLFVGNLPDSCTQDALVALMSNYGQVVSSHMMTAPSASGAICAFVEYADPMQAKSAIMALDGVYPFPPRSTPMTVSYAKSKGRQGWEGGWGGGAPPHGHGSEVKLFVGNLPGDVSQDELWELFAPFGNLIEAFLFKRGPETAKGAFVRFTDWANAQQAIASMHGQSVRGNSIVVEPARGADGKGGGKGGEAPPVTPPPLYNYSDPTAYYQAWSQYYAQMGYAMPTANPQAAQATPNPAYPTPTATTPTPYLALPAPSTTPVDPSAATAAIPLGHPTPGTTPGPTPTPAPPAVQLSGAGSLGFPNFPVTWSASSYATPAPYPTAQLPAAQQAGYPAAQAGYPIAQPQQPQQPQQAQPPQQYPTAQAQPQAQGQAGYPTAQAQPQAQAQTGYLTAQAQVQAQAQSGYPTAQAQGGYPTGSPAVETSPPSPSRPAATHGGDVVTLSLTNIPPEYEEAHIAYLLTNFPGYQGLQLHKATDGGSSSASITYTTSEVARNAQSVLHNFVVGQHRLSCSIKPTAARPY